MPDWEDLWTISVERDGLFHVREARERGISDKLLHESSRVRRVEGFRGVHRFVLAPMGRWYLNNAAFLWSKEEGVISHGSALEVWGIATDWMPHHAEMTLPTSWRERLVPPQVLAFYDDLPAEDVVWFTDRANFRVTTARRSVDDFIKWGIRPDLARQAIEQATSRRRAGGALFRPRDLKNRHLLT